MPAGQGEEERFAAAVEQGAPPGAVDDELARELELVAMLRAAGPALGPAPDAKARARQRLMAAFAEEFAAPAGARADETTQLQRVPALDPDATTVGRLEPVTDTADTGDDSAVDTAEDSADGTASVTELVPRSGRRAGRHAIPGVGSAPQTGRKRAAVIGAATLITGMALVGTAAASDNALPGSPLYAFKGASESTGLALTFDDDEKARRYLALASTRLDEVEQMVTGEGSTADPVLVQSTMDEFDASASEGSRMLLSAETDPDNAAVGEVRAWATEEQARLAALRDDLPAPVVLDADSSIELLDDLLGRTEALQDLGEDELTGSGRSDSAGTAGDTRARTSAPAQRSTTAGSDERTGDAGSSAEVDAGTEADEESGARSASTRDTRPTESARSGDEDDETSSGGTESGSGSGSGSGGGSGGLVGQVTQQLPVVGGLLGGS